MIAGVVATLADSADRLKQTVTELVMQTGLEVGPFQPDDRRIPLTIDAPTRSVAEELTDWIRSRAGVVLVDVICVHFEEADVAATPSPDGARRRESRPHQESGV